MKVECKFNGIVVGLIEIEGEIPNGVSEFISNFYRSFSHLKMYEQFKAGIPTFMEVEINGNLVYLELIEHNGKNIKVRKSEKTSQKERKFGSMKELVENIADDFDAPLEDFKDYM